MPSRNEKIKTLTNSKYEILDARVVANYGDPGTSENYFFDILSRYVVVMIESCDRVPTLDKYLNMFAIVKRPEYLWISAVGGNTGNPSTQKRADNSGNVNVGLASSFSTSGIASINRPYYLGEKIKIRKLSQPLTYSTSPSFFTSDFSRWASDTFLYGDWHTSGSSIPYFANDAYKIQSLKNKTIEPSTIALYFNFYLNKYQFEAFSLNNNTDSSVLSNLTRIFSGQWTSGTPIYTANGGYVFGNKTKYGDGSYILLAGCEYEDLNTNNKARTTSNDCIPLVVATQSSFPTPKQRATGTINYNPTYATIQK